MHIVETSGGGNVKRILGRKTARALSLAGLILTAGCGDEAGHTPAVAASAPISQEPDRQSAPVGEAFGLGASRAQTAMYFGGKGFMPVNAELDQVAGAHMVSEMTSDLDVYARETGSCASAQSGSPSAQCVVAVVGYSDGNQVVGYVIFPEVFGYERASYDQWAQFVANEMQTNLTSQVGNFSPTNEFAMRCAPMDGVGPSNELISVYGCPKAVIVRATGY